MKTRHFLHESAIFINIRMNNIILFIKKYWLLILLVAQPLLDIFAFFTASDSGTAAGYIRLAVMLLLAIYVLLKRAGGKRTIIALAVIAAVFGAHVLNCIRVGYASPMQDISYAARVAYMPVMAVCFCALMKDEVANRQVFTGAVINFAIIAVVLIISYLTGSYTPTYGEGGGLGTSGWVIMDNRCCHSDILSSLAVLACYAGIASKRLPARIILPVVVFIAMVTNGTQACYLTLLAVMLLFPVFILLRAAILREKPAKEQVISVALMLALFAGAIIIYPYTPRCKMEIIKNSTYNDMQERFEAKLQTMGYNAPEVTPEDIQSDPELYAAYKDYYARFLYGEIPAFIEGFDFDRILKVYDYTYQGGILGDNRLMKQKYAALLSEDCDGLTHVTGFEIATIGPDMSIDMENDWYAIFYYYGYLGLAFYVLGALYLFARIIRLLASAFKSSLNTENFALLIGFCLLLGLAYFSGAVLRRPNASIYIALFIGMIYNNTMLKAKKEVTGA